ncbi:NADPH dehydrogenase NamA [Athalassotoga sp.]|uniref:NADPH dehydrogenase NamA n=1 Tax=Athalassotoga sp. TaxID=2022597 RepID=UPI003CFD361A
MIFEPFKIGNLELKNRIVMPPMCQYSSDNAGSVKSWHISHYVARAIGGVGLIIVEATAVDPDGRISPNDLGIWDDSHVEGLKTLVERVHENGAKVAIQLAHAGRKSKATDDPVAPSAIRYSEHYGHPHELTQGEINQIVEKFQNASRRAKESGFDGIEIHAAHGYLLNEFLSPLTNKRTDRYGGSIEKRARILIEIVSAVREVWDKPLWIRVSASDYAKGGNDVDDTIDILNFLKDKIDGVNVSGGGLVHDQSVKVYPGYMIDNAGRVKIGTNLAVIGGGLINSLELSEYSLNSEKCDLVFVGRQLLRDPYWPLKIAHEAGIDMEWPFQYERAKDVTK